jgi:hypothetical protein
MTYKFDIAGTTYEVPLLKDAPIGVVRKARKAGNDMDATFIILETMLGEESPELAAVDTLSASAFADWMKGWTQGASLGEASGSSN